MNFFLIIGILIAFVVIVQAISILSGDYLLQNISKKFKFPKNADVIILAIGCSIPEMITNIISVFDEKSENFNYGFGVIIGSGVFGKNLQLDFTVCFGIAGIYSFLHHKKNIKFNIKAVLRDYFVYIITLCYLALICLDKKIEWYESLGLVLIYPFYVTYLLITNRGQQRKKSDDQEVKQNDSQILKLNDTTISIIDQNDLQEQKILNQKELNIDERSLFQKLSRFFFKILDFLIPKDKYPALSFFIIILIISQQTKIMIYLVDIVVDNFHLTPVFLGLTIGSWSGNIGDIVNSSMAAKQLKSELAICAIIGGQIVNLQLSLGLPYFIYNIMYGPIIFQDNQQFYYFKLILIMIFSGNKLNHKMGLSMLILYAGYFVHQIYNCVQ